MTEFETKLIEQLEILNRNLSTQKVQSNMTPKPNLAEYIIGIMRSIDKKLEQLNLGIGTIVHNISK